jgi:cytidine deaminase
MIVTGNNQENAAYPSGLCAERVALYFAQSKYPGNAVECIAITAHSPSFEIDEPVPPCGACRQVMAEYEDRHTKPMRVIMAGTAGKVIIADGMEHLLPLRFNADKLKK